MKKRCRFIFKEDEDRAKDMLKRAAKAKDINEITPFFSGVNVYVKFTRADLVDKGPYYFDVQLDEEGPSVNVIIEDGTNCLPDKIKNLAIERKWFCIKITKIYSKSSEEISLAIFYDDNALLLFHHDVTPWGPHSEIYSGIGQDTYLAYYSLHPLTVGDDNEFSCSMSDDGAFVFDDPRGIDFLYHCLRVYAAA